MKTAAIYCRVSTEDQEKEGTSLQTQLDACLKHCQDNNYHVVYRFSEAYSGLALERPKLDEVRELVRSEQIDVVVVHCLDRLSRDPTHGVILTQELDKHHVTLETVTEDTDNSELGKFINYVRGFASKLEAEKIRERTMRGKRARASEGKIPHGGFARLYGYGYDRVLKRRVVNETEAEWVVTMFEWLVNEGVSTNTITYRLRDFNAPTKASSHWNRSSVMAILKNPAYTGKTYAFTFHQGTNRRKPPEEWVEIRDATPRIISDEMFEAAQSQLRSNYEKSRRNTRRQYLLRSHLYCRQCGRAYCGHTERNIGYYCCPGKLRITAPVDRCHNKNWRVDEIEALAWKHIERVLNHPEVIVAAMEAQRNSANNLGTLESELQRVERQLATVALEQRELLQWALKGFPEETVVAENKRMNQERNGLVSRKTELESQIKESRDAVVSLPKLESYVQLIRSKLTCLDFDMKRLALDMLGIKVWVDGSSVEITGTIPIQDVDVVTTAS